MNMVLQCKEEEFGSYNALIYVHDSLSWSHEAIPTWKRKAAMKSN